MKFNFNENGDGFVCDFACDLKFINNYNRTETTNT